MLPASSDAPETPVDPPTPSNRKKYLRIIAPILAVALAIALYFIWFFPGSTQGTSTQSFSSGATNDSATASNTTNSSSNSSGGIHVYVVGAIKHPGVYTLPAGARVYQLIQAAGGTLPNANLVALNLAATLSDGQEVYVIAIGESPPSYIGGVPGPGSGTNGTPTANGQLVNINTASVEELRSLHISSTTAQNIVNYRTQHGPFTSISQLAQVVSRSIYDKIKGQVTI